MLDKVGFLWYNNKAVGRKDDRARIQKNSKKFFEKSFEKDLTNS